MVDVFFLVPLAIVGALAVGCNSLEDRLDPQPKDIQPVGQKVRVGFYEDSPASKAKSIIGHGGASGVCVTITVAPELNDSGEVSDENVKKRVITH